MNEAWLSIGCLPRTRSACCRFAAIARPWRRVRGVVRSTASCDALHASANNHLDHFDTSPVSITSYIRIYIIIQVLTRHTLLRLGINYCYTRYNHVECVVRLSYRNYSHRSAPTRITYFPRRHFRTAAAVHGTDAGWGCIETGAQRWQSSIAGKIG